VTGIRTWTERLKLASNVLHVLALLTAVVSSAIPTGWDGSNAVAAVVASLGVAFAFTATVPFPVSARREIAAMVGSLSAYCVAIGLTGGIDSSYTLLPVATIFLASVGGGIRVAAPVAAIATIGVFVAAAIGDSLEVTANLIRIAAIYTLTAIAFSEAQRAIAAQAAITDEALLAADVAGSRRMNLEATHSLLEDLVAVASSPNVNAVATAQDAIRDAFVIFPSVSSRIIDHNGTVLARRGPEQSSRPSTLIKVESGHGDAASLELWVTDAPPNEDQQNLLRTALIPVGLAIENNTMLLEVAGLAVQRERVRLARELHDDIAPSVASVGLTLDMLLLTDQLDTEQTRNVQATRQNIAALVDRIRDRVQDLRADRSKSLTEFIHGLVAEVDTDGPTVVISLDERTPPRPAIAAEVRAMLTESFRNALDHADASVIDIGGRISEGGGTVTIQDNGTGFDSTTVSDSRFGLVGMQERASLIGGHFTIESAPRQGTVVTISWRDGT